MDSSWYQILHNMFLKMSAKLNKNIFYIFVNRLFPDDVHVVMASGVTDEQAKG